jgi:hypothetical protein
VGAVLIRAPIVQTVHQHRGLPCELDMNPGLEPRVIVVFVTKQYNTDVLRDIMEEP